MAACARALTLPGFVHDASALPFTPLGVASPFMRTVPLIPSHGVTWINSPASGSPPLTMTALPLLLETLSPADGEAWGRMQRPMSGSWPPLVRHWEALVEELLQSSAPAAAPLRMASLVCWPCAQPRASRKRGSTGPRARGFLRDLSSWHLRIMPLDKPANRGLRTHARHARAHAVGWPLPQESQQLATALAAYLRTLGGELITWDARWLR